MARSMNNKIAKAYVLRARERRLRKTFQNLVSTPCRSCRTSSFASFLKQQQRLRTIVSADSTAVLDASSPSSKSPRKWAPCRDSLQTSSEMPAPPSLVAVTDEGKKPVEKVVSASAKQLVKETVKPQVGKPAQTAPQIPALAVSHSSINQSPKRQKKHPPPVTAPPTARTKSLPPGPALAGQRKPTSGPPPVKSVVTSGRVSKAWPGNFGKPKIRGLRNPRNWCYRRSLLQALMRIPQLYNLLEASHGQCQKACVACNLGRLVEAYHGTGDLGSCVTSLDNAIRMTGKSSDPKWTAVGQSQEDSHEFLQYLMGTVENARGIQKQQFRDLFQVGHRITWHCTKCNIEHVKEDPPSYSLQLPIDAPRGQPITLTTCLNAYHREDNLEIRCDRCKKNLPRTRFHRIQNPPEILFIQLKRFAFAGRQAMKNTKRVQYSDTLNLAQWSATPSQPLNYRLKAIVAHSGSLRMGHYVAVVESEEGVRWVSDDSVRKATVDDLKNPRGFAPYILMYVKQ